MRFSVVIPTMARAAVLSETVKSLLSCDPPPDELIIVDADGSARAVAEAVGSGPTRVVYLRSEPSATAQRNLGIDTSQGDAVVFLDDDVVVPADLFRALAVAYEDPHVVGVTGRVVEEADQRIGNPRSWVRRLIFRGKQGRFTRYGFPRYVQGAAAPGDVEYMLGCFMSARRDDASAVRFDEALGGYALAEDEDFSYRLSRRGRIRYLADVVVFHHKFGFASVKNTREFSRLVVRNRAYVFRKNFPQTLIARLGFAWLLVVLFVHRLLNRQWSAARGVLDGALELGRGSPRP